MKTWQDLTLDQDLFAKIRYSVSFAAFSTCYQVWKLFFRLETVSQQHNSPGHIYEAFQFVAKQAATGWGVMQYFFSVHISIHRHQRKLQRSWLFPLSLALREGTIISTALVYKKPELYGYRAWLVIFAIVQRSGWFQLQLLLMWVFFWFFFFFSAPKWQ